MIREIESLYLYAKGFEKEFEEQTMPDYYNEQISKEEMAALVAYVLSLK